MPLELFYCYAHQDKNLRDELDQHLSVLKRTGLVTSWFDGDILPGTVWEKAITDHLKTADLILLLITASFIHSDYCYSTEMMRALDRHKTGKAIVIPVLLRPVDWEGTPFSTLQMLPSGAEPVTRWINRDDAFKDITKGIRRVIRESEKNRKRSEQLEQAYEIFLASRPTEAPPPKKTAQAPLSVRPDEIRELSTLTDSKGSFCNIAMSSDGRMLARGCENGIKLWELPSGQALSTLTGSTSSVKCTAISPDDQTFIGGSDDGTIRLWKLPSKQKPLTLTGHMGNVRCVTFSPDGTFFASGSGDSTIKLWEASSGKELHTFSGHRSGVRSIAISPDGTILASGSLDRSVRLWELSSGRTLCTFISHVRCSFSSIAFGPDGHTLAGATGRAIKLWELPSGQELLSITGSGHDIWSVAFGPDGHMLAGGDWAGTIKLWELPSGQELHTFVGHRGSVISMTFRLDGTLLASASHDSTIKLWGGKRLPFQANFVIQQDTIPMSPISPPNRFPPGERKNSIDYYNDGLTLIGQERYEEALEALEQAAKLNPKYSRIYSSQGLILSRLDYDEEALERYDQAIRLAPASDIAHEYILKASSLCNLDRYDEAITCYNQAISLDSGQSDKAYAYYAKGHTLERIGRPKEAQQCYDQARQHGYNV